jgi:hypothetical protein
MYYVYPDTPSCLSYDPRLVTRRPVQVYAINQY